MGATAYAIGGGAAIAAETMNRIAKSAEIIERLEPRLAVARTELHAAIREAHDEGVAQATIARVAGLSRERVRQIVASS